MDHITIFKRRNEPERVSQHEGNLKVPRIGHFFTVLKHLSLFQAVLRFYGRFGRHSGLRKTPLDVELDAIMDRLYQKGRELGQCVFQISNALYGDELDLESELKREWYNLSKVSSFSPDSLGVLI